jgi:glucose/arabinose dehydrogenase
VDREPSSPADGQAAAPAGPQITFPPARRIRVPDGFRAEIYATGLERPTAMAYGPDGRLYVAEETGDVVAVRLPGGGGRAPPRRVVVEGLPFGRHQQDNVVVGSDGRLYFGSGSTCDACREKDARSAAVLSVLPSGRSLRIVARGLRNPFGLAFQPGTGRLFATVNGQDNLPDPSAPEPAEMLVQIHRGAHYGWPRCWPSWSRKRMVGDCQGVTRPVAYLETHSSADGLTFYRGSTFPDRYRSGVFVALWGQYASREHGRRVDFVSLRADGTSPRRGVTPFAQGFDHPLALAVDPAGALLVSDWGRGLIYRIQAKGAP